METGQLLHQLVWLIKFLFLSFVISFLSQSCLLDKSKQDDSALYSKDINKKTIYVPTFKNVSRACFTKNNGNYCLNSDLIKNDLIVHFWATWCVPCLEELPRLITSFESNSKINIKLILVSVNDSTVNVELFFRKKKIQLSSNIELLFDNEDTSYVIFGVSKVPETFFINHSSETVVRKPGPQNWD